MRLVRHSHRNLQNGKNFKFGNQHAPIRDCHPPVESWLDSIVKRMHSLIWSTTRAPHRFVAQKQHFFCFVFFVFHKKWAYARRHNQAKSEKVRRKSTNANTKTKNKGVAGNVSGKRVAKLSCQNFQVSIRKILVGKRRYWWTTGWFLGQL